MPKATMRVWIVNPYGTLPSEGWREYRSSMLACALAERGHEVTWWISNFEHRSKTFRGQGVLSDPMLPKGVRVIGVNSTPYRRNISLQRIRYEISYGHEMARMAEKASPPDVIVMGDPALFYGAPVLEFRQRVGCKLILDVIDLWPELFTVALPKFLQTLGLMFFAPLYKRRDKLVESCDGIVAVSEDYLSIVLQGQRSKPPSLVSYLGIDVERERRAPINHELAERLQEFKKGHGLLAVYAGTLGDAYDINLLLSAVMKASDQGDGIAFLVAGDGPRKRDVEECAQMHPKHLLFLGSVPSVDLQTIYQNADVGLITYVAGSTVAMPVKFFDYISGGLAVINSLDKDVGRLISKNRIGLKYNASNFDSFFGALKYYANHTSELVEAKSRSKKMATDYDSKEQHRKFAMFLEGQCLR